MNKQEREEARRKITSLRDNYRDATFGKILFMLEKALNEIDRLEGEAQGLEASLKKALDQKITLEVESKRGKAQLCPVCGGDGEISATTVTGVDYSHSFASETILYTKHKPCHGCGGKGWIK